MWMLLMAAAGKKRRKAAPTQKAAAGAAADVIYSFGALVHETVLPHTLILGTMCSVESLRRQQSYGHPQNAFWKICGEVLGFTRSTTAYDEQTRRLTAAGFVLWDVLHSCQRVGSLDGDIRNEKPNDIAGLLERHPTIRRVVLNGQPAAQFFRKHLAGLLRQHAWRLGNASAETIFAKVARLHTDGRVLVVMPSTSPANASMSYTTKLDIWRVHCFYNLITEPVPLAITDRPHATNDVFVEQLSN